jgi:hypothetical protein
MRDKHILAALLYSAFSGKRSGGKCSIVILGLDLLFTDVLRLPLFVTCYVELYTSEHVSVGSGGNAQKVSVGEFSFFGALRSLLCLDHSFLSFWLLTFKLQVS